MKRYYVCRLFALLGVLVLLGSCNKEWLDVNEDTNNTTETNIKPELILPQALLSTASIHMNSFEFLERWMGYWCVPAGMFANPFEVAYEWPNPMSDQLYSEYMSNSTHYAFIIDKWQKEGYGFYAGISRIMKAHNFGILTDVFNNIPYREALQGVKNMTPAYDKGRFIYEDLITELDTAISQIKRTDVAANPKILAADITFHGDKEKWVRFANTLKLRLLMHQANVSGRAAYIQEQVSRILAEGTGFLGSGESAAVNPGFAAENGKQNPYYERYGFNYMGNPSYNGMLARANTTALDYLKLHNDPRLAYFYKPISMPVPAGASEPFPQPAPVNFRGNQYGLSVNPGQYRFQGVSYTSGIGGSNMAGAVQPGSSGILKGYNMDMWLLTSVESLFLQAEAVARGWVNGDAADSYKAALRESFLWLNVDGSQQAAKDAFDNWYQAQSGLGDADVSWEAAPDKLKLIFFQKYLALNGTNALEAWTDYRRNGQYPAIPLSAAPGRGNRPLPVRLPYPQMEFNFNLEHVKAEGTIDYFTSKIWWMP